LVGALAAGAIVGGSQLHQLSETIQASTAPTIVWTRIAVSLLSVGAPVWFAWLATKQIGQRFRLSEDYAYKASISKAYEGYRREAAQLDEDFQKRLLASALARLDEQPLRFVEHVTHGSPWHELLGSGRCQGRHSCRAPIDGGVEAESSGYCYRGKIAQEADRTPCGRGVERPRRSGIIQRDGKQAKAPRTAPEAG
jgi:hypothetical protein